MFFHFWDVLSFSKCLSNEQARPVMWSGLGLKIRFLMNRPQGFIKKVFGYGLLRDDHLADKGSGSTLEIEGHHLCLLALARIEEPAIGYNMAECQVFPIGLSSK